MVGAREAPLRPETALRTRRALLALAGLFLVATAQAQIAFRAAGSAGSPSGTLTLAVPVPATTAAGDFLLATIGVRPNTATITAPAGWTLLIRTNQTTIVGSSQAIYYRLAVLPEPATYTCDFRYFERIRGRHQRILGGRPFGAHRRLGRSRDAFEPDTCGSKRPDDRGQHDARRPTSASPRPPRGFPRRE